MIFIICLVFFWHSGRIETPICDRKAAFSSYLPARQKLTILFVEQTAAGSVSSYPVAYGEA
jgi:hypothetical protein